MNNPHQLSGGHAILDIVGNFFANVHQFHPSAFFGDPQLADAPLRLTRCRDALCRQ